MMDELLLLLLFTTVLCALLGLGGWYIEWILHRRRTLPPPNPKAIAGQSHKPWMEGWK